MTPPRLTISAGDLRPRAAAGLLVAMTGVAAAALTGLLTIGPAHDAAQAAPVAPVSAVPVASASAVSVAPTVIATRWWSVPGAAVGSRIDPGSPESVARRLHPSRPDYCLVLRQTVAAGRSLSAAGGTADDPATVLATRAFAAEVGALAPSGVRAPWRQVAGALVALTDSGGDLTKVHGLDVKAVGVASTAVATDARGKCGLDLAATHTTKAGR